MALTTGLPGSVAPTPNSSQPVGVGVSDLDGQSKWYVVIISSSRWGTVQAWLPDTIDLVTKSHWGPIVGNIENSLANWLAGNFGDPRTSLFSKKLTAQEWKGTEPLTLVLQLHFFATSDANMEVVEPIKRLMKMSLPRQINENFFGLQAPGPVPAGAKVPDWVPGIGGITVGGRGKFDEDIINVYIGNFITIKEVFIDAIPTIEFKGKLSTDGWPMEGVVSVMFKTVYCPTTQDIDTYIGAAIGTRPDLG